MILPAGLILGAAIALFFSDRVWTDWQTDVGYSRLVAELGLDVSGGKSVPVAQVEAAVRVNHRKTWIPDGTKQQFEHKTIVNVSGAADNVFSGHATTVGRLFYGCTASMAGEVDDIQAFCTTHWLGRGHLRAGMGYRPLISDRRVVNHSWVGGFNDYAEADGEILRRLDWVVDRDEMIHTVGLTNSPASANPLLAAAFNVIRVGRTDACHSRCTAAVDDIYTGGRPCPDLVVPMHTTSTATPVVAGAAAILIQMGHDHPALSTDPVQISTTRRDGHVIYNAERSEVIRAVLFSAADRVTRNISDVDILGYRQAKEHRADNGMDIRYGAGQLDIHAACRILTAGEQNSREDGGKGVTGTAGFDYDPFFGGLNCNDTATYQLTPDEAHCRLTAALVWNIAIDGGSPIYFNGKATLYNLDMGLKNLTTGTTIAISDATDGNSEHFRLVLTPGHDYALTVRRGPYTPAFCHDYAIAWTLRAKTAGFKTPENKITPLTQLITPIRAENTSLYNAFPE